MNAGATQDIRAIDTVPLLAKVLKGSTAPSAQAQQMLSLLVAWRASGGSRLDRDNDGAIDDPGAAIMDVAFPLIANNAMAPIIGPQLDELDSLFNRFDQPPGGQYQAGTSTWTGTCGRCSRRSGSPTNSTSPTAASGKLGACQQSIWAAIQAAGQQLTADQGTADPAAWRSRRDRRAHQLLPDPADQHALHEPSERDPAGHLVQEVT